MIISSCTSTYIPNAISAPLLSEKGDLNVSLCTGKGLILQSAYAIDNNVGIMLNASEDINSNNFVEFGAGYFNTWNKNGVFEIYQGYGLGNLKHFYGIDASKYFVRFLYNLLLVIKQNIFKLHLL